MSETAQRCKKVREFVPQVSERDWGQEIIVAQTDTYLGKKLVMKAGTAGGYQYHVDKEETFLLHEGRALVDTTNCAGKLVHIEMFPGMVMHVEPGARHRVHALTDCVFYEWSTVHFDDRVRAEHEIGEETNGGLPTTREV